MRLPHRPQTRGNGTQPLAQTYTKLATCGCKAGRAPYRHPVRDQNKHEAPPRQHHYSRPQLTSAQPSRKIHFPMRPSQKKDHAATGYKVEEAAQGSQATLILPGPQKAGGAIPSQRRGRGRGTRKHTLAELTPLQRGNPNWHCWQAALSGRSQELCRHDITNSC